MNRYRLSQQSEQDLEDIWLYIAQNDQVAADLMITKILNKLPMLAQFSDLGRERNDLMSGLRCFPVKPYLIFYTPSNQLEIIRILHQSRDLESQFNRPE